jgi:predicted flap endonuclease-1-like 5' DNA nuclease
MSLLFDVIFAQECTSTHHKLAMDALRHLRDDDATLWQNLFLKHFDCYLDGAKAPDKKFKDFRNHVLHVRENYWGGAVRACEDWYGRTVRALREGNWTEAIYAAGVLSHYYTDPIMPLHTGQTEAEGQIHRAVEWSITKSYGEFQNILEQDLDGYPTVEAPEADDWLAQMVRKGAALANPHYELIIDHYDLDKGVKDPPAGLDQEIKDCIAQLVGYAAVGFARILERAFDEADVQPPVVMGLTLRGYLASLSIPICWLERKIVDARDRAVVRAMYQELQQTGRVLKTLPEDDKTIRALHAEEVLKVPLSELDKQQPGKAGTKHGEGETARERPQKPVTKTVQPQPKRDGETAKDSKQSLSGERPRREKPSLRFYLSPSSDVVDAPSIGPKTAARLAPLAVKTVADLLALDPDEAAAKLRVRHIDAGTIRDWQAQATLVCRIPNLRGHHAQVLVACDCKAPDQVAAARADELSTAIEAFAKTRDGQRTLRAGPPPRPEEIAQWIAWASNARPLKAA